MQTQLSRSLQALGRKPQALALQQATQGLQATTAQFPQAREAWLNLGEALAWQAQIASGRPESLRSAARDAYDHAAALGALKAEFAQARAALN